MSNGIQEIDDLKAQLAREIEARKTAEDRLCECRADLLSVTDNIQDVFYRSDNKGRLIMASKSWLHVSGYDSMDDCLGFGIAEKFYYYPEKRGEFIDLIRKNGSVSNYETVLKKKDGSPIFVETSSHIYYDKEGNPAGVEGVFRDVTDRIKAERERRGSEEMMKAIVNASPVPQFVIDTNHRIIHWNRSLEEYSGLSAGEMKGTDMQWRAFYSLKRPCLCDLLIDDKSAEMAEWYKGKFTPSKLIDGAYEAVDFFPEMKGGKWLYFTAAVIRGENGEISGAVETLIDITESKIYEQVLKENEERFRTIFDSSPMGIVQTTLDGRILSANRFFCDMMNYDENEITGMTIADLSFAEDLERERPMVRKLHDSRHNYYSFEKRYRRKDGESLWGHVSIAYIHDHEGRKISAIAIIENITDRKKADDDIKRMENQLIQSQKAEALGTLAGGIAHDFNNILAAIIGYTELAKINISNSQKAMSELDEVLKSSERAKNLVNQILAFSRKTKIDYSPVDLNSVITDSLKMLRSVIPSDIEIRHNLEESIMVMSEPTQIHQILMNLSINAAQAMEKEGGTLTVNLSSISIIGGSAEELDLKPGHYARISVIDNGAGIAPEIREKIFLPYFTTKERGRGTGLGLAVIQGIIKKHEGIILCSSTPGRGSTFDIYLPEIKSMGDLPVKKTDEDLITGSGTILFVDDEPSLAAMGSEMLKTLGYDVIAETSSVRALEIFMENPHAYDLVITDMTMPAMTGDKLAEKIRAVRSDIPVIICTGYSEKISDKRILEIGLSRLCMKPLELKSMAIAIHQALNG